MRIKKNKKIFCKSLDKVKGKYYISISSFDIILNLKTLATTEDKKYGGD
jgi:hypothetical protein